MNKMHQMIRTHNCYIFLPLRFSLPPRGQQGQLRSLHALFEVFAADLALAPAVNGRACFIGQADCGEERFLVAGIYFQRVKRKTGLLMHLAHGSLMELLARFHRACREFVDVVINGNAVLAHQDNFVAFSPYGLYISTPSGVFFLVLIFICSMDFCAGKPRNSGSDGLLCLSLPPGKDVTNGFSVCFCDFFNIRHK